MFKKRFCSQIGKFYIKERLNHRDIESKLINKLTSDLFSNQNKNNCKIWINFPSQIDPSEKSINNIYQLIVQDVINRQKIKQGYTILNNIRIKSSSSNDISLIKEELKSTGIIFDENDLSLTKSKDNYINTLKIVKKLVLNNKLKINHKTVFWDRSQKEVVDGSNLEELKELTLSMLTKLPVTNMKRVIENINVFLSTTPDNVSTKNKSTHIILMNKHENYTQFHKLLKEEDYSINIIAFLNEPWRYIGITAIECSFSMNLVAFTINSSKTKEIFICSSKRLPEICKRMNLKQSKDIEIILHFTGEDILSEVKLTDPIYSREIKLINNSQVSEFYGSGFNILTPGHDALHEITCLKNKIGYRGYINNSNEAYGLEIFSPKLITNEYILNLLKRKNSLLAEFEYQFSSYINKLTNNRLILKTIPSMEIIIDDDTKSNYLKEYCKVINIPEGKFENKAKKMIKGHFETEESYRHLVEEINSIFKWSINKNDRNIINNKDKAEQYSNCAIPVVINSLTKDFTFDINILDEFIDFISTLGKDEAFNPYIKDDFALGRLDYIYIDDLFFQSSSWENTNNNLDNDTIASNELRSLISELKYLELLKNSSNLSSVENYLVNKYNVNSQIEEIKHKISLLSNNLNNDEYIKTINSKANIICQQKEQHKGILLYSSLLSFILKGSFPYSILKTLGHVLTKKGDISQINYLDIINGVEIFNFFDENDDKKFGYGADALRLMLSSNDNDKDLILLESDISNVKQDIRSIRRMARQLSLLYKLKESNIEYYDKLLPNSELYDLTQLPLKIYKSAFNVDFSKLNIIDQHMIYKYSIFLDKILYLETNEKLKDVIYETLQFIKDHVNYYLILSLRRLSDLSDKSEKSDKHKDLKFLERLYQLIWINTQTITSILSILSPIIPFNTQFIYESLYDSKGNVLTDIEMNSKDNLDVLVSKMTKTLEENLIYKLKILSDIQIKVRKYTIAAAKLHKIPLKDIVVCLVTNKNSMEDDFLTIHSNDLKYLFNVSKVQLINSKDDIVSIGKYKQLFNKEIKVISDEVRFKLDCFILCDIDYVKEHDSQKTKDTYEKPFEQSSNNKIDKFYVKNNKKH